MKIFQNKLSADIAWTLGSFVTLAVSGIVINLLIAAFRDASALGVFNLSYAVYIVASQIAVFGLQYSVMRHTALYSDNLDERDKLLFNAAFLAFLLGVIAFLTIWLGQSILAWTFNSDTTAKAIQNAAFGLVFFPLNKVLLAYLNGLREMKAFSALQSWRYLTIMCWVALVSASEYEFEIVTLGFFVAEFTTTIGALSFLIRRKVFPIFKVDAVWLKRHFEFGGKSLFAGMFVEMNSRVDVLMLGIFLPTKAVGIYSFAAMLVDGLYQVLAIIRINFNPILVAAIRDQDWDGARGLLARSKRLCYPVAVGLVICIVFGFWILTAYMVPEKELIQGMAPLVILLLGLTCISPFVPFDNVLLASGHPGYQTIQHLAVVISNVAFNALLIPVWGIMGAGLATMASYFVGMTVLILMVKRFLRWNLLTNHVRV